MSKVAFLLQSFLVLIHLIPKASGGVRPIALLHILYRVLMKIRGGAQLEAWKERKKQRNEHAGERAAGVDAPDGGFITPVGLPEAGPADEAQGGTGIPMGRFDVDDID